MPAFCCATDAAICWADWAATPFTSASLGDDLARTLGQLGAVLDHLRALLRGGHRGARGVLDVAEDGLHLRGGLLGLLGQVAHLVGHDGEALALLTSARRLDRGVERQEVGLVGEVVHGVRDLADLRRLVRQRLHVTCDGVHLVVDIPHPDDDRVHRLGALA